MAYSFILQIVVIQTLADMEPAGQSDHPMLVTASRDTLEQTVTKRLQVSLLCYLKSHILISTTVFIFISVALREIWTMRGAITSARVG